MDERLAPVPAVVEFADRIRSAAGMAGVYVGGSLAYGDYRPGISDIDVIAVAAEPLRRPARRAVAALHREYEARPETAKLHCAYVPQGEAADLAAEHWYWAAGELYRRTVSGIARAELLRGGITVYGPPPGDVLPGLTAAEVRAAALGELSGYWTRAVGKPRLWSEDWCVDLGLVTLARVEATVLEDRLITKGEALGRLGGFGVPEWLVAEMAARRAGAASVVKVTAKRRRERGELARGLVAAGIARLLGEGAATEG